ncbi:DUF6011 domain-containing protein [Streptomyces sp. BoleA5]|uniref:DUF6011 domain-containing protein n=1 Tax=Streptomyces sp. BoleA5 TaxID=1157637 RepID=UPI003B631B9D
MPRAARRKCGRILKSEASRQRGYGPECWRAIGGGYSRTPEGVRDHRQGDVINAATATRAL